MTDTIPFSPPIPTNGFTPIHKENTLSLFEKINPRLRPAARIYWFHALLHCRRYDEDNGLKRGQFYYGRRALSIELGIPEQTIRSLEKTLYELTEILASTNNHGTLVTILKYDCYVIDGIRSNNPVTIHQQSSNNKPKEKGERRNKEKATAYPAEARGALEIWTAIAPLPETASEDAALKTLIELNRIDGLSWDRINRICTHAAKFWVPGRFIASPAKLRKPTKSGEMKTWEAIERQLSAPHQNGIHPPVHPITAASTAAPTTSLRALHLANTHQPTSPPSPSPAQVIAAELVGDAP